MIHKHLNILRTQKRKKFLYLKASGGKVTDATTLKRISELHIPPGYNNVKISSTNNNKLQATGVDNKGRVQYIYNSKHIEKQGQIKFKELINFGKKIEKIRKDVMNKIKDNDNVHSKNKIISLVIYLIDNCLFRVGNKFYAKEYNTYGTTTLKAKHFKYKHGTMYIEFVGKKNVVNHCVLSNKFVVPLLNKLLKSAGKTNNVFRYTNSKGNLQEITANDINNYLKSFDSKLMVKMFLSYWKF